MGSLNYNREFNKFSLALTGKNEWELKNTEYRDKLWKFFP